MIGAKMFLRSNYRAKDGKEHIYWSLVETVRTVDGPRQRTLCYLGELNGSAQARWLKSVEVFQRAGRSRNNWKLFPSHIEVPDGDPQVARVLVHRDPPGENPPVRRLFSGMGVVEASGTGCFF